MARQGKEGLRTVTFPQTIKKIIITVTVIFTIITNKFSTSDQLSCTARSPTKPRSSDALDSVKDSTEIQDDDIFLEVPLDALKSPDSPDPSLAPLPNVDVNTTTTPHPPIPSDSPGNL